MIRDSKNHGFTLLEILLGLGIFVIIAGAVYFSYANVLQTVISSQFNLGVLNLAESEIESVRNLPYDQIGLVGGVPAGILPPEKQVLLGGTEFTVRTTVRNIDDSFDGQIGGVPNDFAPADYKLVEIEVGCVNCGRAPAKLTARVAPRDLEGSTKNGALFIHVFDAFGQPLSEVAVQVINQMVSPTINLTDSTGLNGSLQLVDVATSSAAYEISVSKPGYSSERTYPLGGVGNPNPVKPHATVAKQEVTSISFAIDKVSLVNLKTTDQFCQAVPGLPFSQTGAKLIGTDPDVLKYSITEATDSQGQKTLGNLEWDTYGFRNLDANYEIAGLSLPLSLIVDPDRTYEMNWLLEPKQPRSLLVVVKDANGQPVSEPLVTLSRTGFSEEQIAGHRRLTVSDWSGSRYFAQSGGIETENPAGQVQLQDLGGRYASHSQQWLESSTIDLGTANTTFYKLFWQPENQPLAAGTDSLKIQLASNNDLATWNFLGPDGTAGTFYTVSNTAVSSLHSGTRYLRYKIFMETEDETVTPRLEELSIEFSSSCVPLGQAFFKGLSSGTYTLTVAKSGYQTLVDNNLGISSNWREYSVVLLPSP